MQQRECVSLNFRNLIRHLLPLFAINGTDRVRTKDQCYRIRPLTVLEFRLYVWVWFEFLYYQLVYVSPR